jgi:hypothetical protein
MAYENVKKETRVRIQTVFFAPSTDAAIFTAAFPSKNTLITENIGFEAVEVFRESSA